MIIKRAFSSSVHNYYDIVIAGGGMIGTALACKLSQNPFLHGLSILLVESAPKKNWDYELVKPVDVFSNRVSTLNSATKALLQNIQVWDPICSAGCRKVTKMKIWGNGSTDISATFNVDELPSSEALAYIVENNILIAAAMKNLENVCNNVKILHGTSITKYNMPKHVDENVILHLKDGPIVECSLLLGTDGANSKVRESMNVQYLTWNYKQKAVVATVKMNEETGNYTAWQKFAPNGPVALLPLSDEFSSLVWTTTPEHADTLIALSNESFVDALNSVLWQEPVQDLLVTSVSKAISSVLETLNFTENKCEVVPPSITDIITNSRATFPVGFGHAACYVNHRVALVGDAAHRVHPLAGQGVNLGFGDIKCLDQVLTKQVSCGSKLGDIEQLRDYETIRQRCNVPKLVGIDLIQRVAGHSWSPLLALTNSAFQITNALVPLKKFLINAASV